MDKVLVKMEGIQKYFPGVHALDNVKFEVNSGEVHALVGENGAGKSTMMKVLTGIYKADGGDIYVEGKKVEITGPKDAQKLGIGIVHQELNLMQHLTVAQNIFIGRELSGKMFLKDKEMNEQTAALLKKFNVDLTPETIVGKLTVAKQQMIEIIRVLSYDAKLIIMDEPSAALTEREIDELFKFIEELRDSGHGIVYISHRMDELLRITNRITVMRDGQYVNTVKTEETTIDDIVHMMVGRVIYEEPKTKSNVAEDAPVVLDVEGLETVDVTNINFKLKKGEILGFSGLIGAGRTETMRAIFGADPKIAGTIKINGKEVSIKSPKDAVNLGIGYLSEDRKRYGVALGLSVATNSAIASLESFTKSGFVDDTKINSAAEEYVEKLSTKTPSIKQLVKNLSGGNQQKVIIAKWLIKNCDILIFDEPTRGIDVGAKNEIYKLMNKLVKEGKSIIMISSEMSELLRMSDRVIVMCEGKITGELDIENADQKSIMTLATQR